MVTPTGEVGYQLSVANHEKQATPWTKRKTFECKENHPPNIVYQNGCHVSPWGQRLGHGVCLT